MNLDGVKSSDCSLSDVWHGRWQMAVTIGVDSSQCVCVSEETASCAFQKLCERADVKSGVRDRRVK